MSGRASNVVALPVPAHGDGDDGDWVLMPPEITEEMTTAAALAFARHWGEHGFMDFPAAMAEAYAAMVDAVESEGRNADDG